MQIEVKSGWEEKKTLMLCASVKAPAARAVANSAEQSSVCKVSGNQNLCLYSQTQQIF